MTTNWQVLIDWDGDGFFCRDTLTTDALNVLPTPVYHGSIETGKSNSTLTKTVEHSKFGIWRYNCTTSGGFSSGGFYFGTNSGGTTNDIPVDASTEYTFSVYIKGTAGKAMKIAAYNQGGSLLAQNTSITLTADYVQHTVTFTTGGSDTYVALRVLKNSDTSDHTFYTRGFMLVEGDTAPTAFNAGSTTNAYDNLEPVESFQWKVGGRPFQSVGDENTATVTLGNIDRLYSPDYASGALYGYFLPNRLMCIYYEDTPQFTGYTKSFKPAPFRFGTRRATIEAYSAKNILELQEIMPVLYEATDIADIMSDILGELILPTNAYLFDLLNTSSAIVSDPTTATAATYANLDDNTFNLAYFGDNNAVENGDRVNGYKLLQELAEAEQGRFYINKDGTLRLRRFTWMDGYNTAIFTVDHIDDMDYSSSAEVRINRVVVKFNPRVEETETVLSDLQSPVVIPNGESRIIRMDYTKQRRPVGGVDVVTPSGGDYTWSAGTPTIDYVDKRGQTVEIKITNSTGSETSLTALEIDGKPLESSTVNVAVDEDASLIASFRMVRELSLNLRAVSTYGHAWNFASNQLLRYKQDLSHIKSITLLAEDESTEAEAMLSYGVGTRLEISDYQLGLTETVHWVIGLQGEVDARSKSLRMKFNLEPNYGGIFPAET